MIHRSQRAAAAIAVALLMTAALLPAASAARWLGGAHGASLLEIENGVWILKGMLAVIAAAVLLTGRVTRLATLPLAPNHAEVARSPSGGLLLGAILLVAVTLRVQQLGAELWFDEIDTLARYVSLDLPQILSTYDSKNHHPLYTLLSRGAFVIGGGTDWWIRIPAVVFGVASLWATFRFAGRVTSGAEALLATLILSVSYHHVWFSQNARGYTAMLFLTLVATGVFVRLTEGGVSRPTRLAWAYGALMGLASYTHLTAALVAVGHALTLLVGTPWRRSRLRSPEVLWPAAGIALSALITLALYSVVLPQAARVLQQPTMGGVQVEWTSVGWMVRETLRVLGQGIPGGLFTLAVALTVLVVGGASYWRQSRMLLLAMMLPVAVTATTMIALGHNLWPRFFFFAAAYFVMLALRGGFVLARLVAPAYAERIAPAGAVAVACLSALTVPRAWQPKQQFMAAAQYVEQSRRAGDEVVALDLAAEVYRLRGAPGRWHLTSELDSVRQIERSAARTWIVYTFPVRLHAQFPELIAYVSAPPFRESRVFPATVGGGEIHVLVNQSLPQHD